jgi:hypothetical protein
MMAVPCQINSIKILDNQKIGNLVMKSLMTGRIFSMKSTNSQVPPRLNAVLYFLYQFPNIDNEEHYSRLINYLLKTHTSEEIADVKDVIDWALITTDFSFSEQLPNLRKTNREILEFFNKLNQKFLANTDIVEKIKTARREE